MCKCCASRSTLQVQHRRSRWADPEVCWSASLTSAASHGEKYCLTKTAIRLVFHEKYNQGTCTCVTLRHTHMNTYTVYSNIILTLIKNLKFQNTLHLLKILESHTKAVYHVIPKSQYLQCLSVIFFMKCNLNKILQKNECNYIFY